MRKLRKIRKLKPNDTGRFVTVYFSDEGKKDGILLAVSGEDDCRVYFPHTVNDEGGIGSNAFIRVDQIVAIGPQAHIEIPLF